MYKRVLLAVDGSENSMRAAAEAAKVAAMGAGSVVEVVYVADFSKSKNEMLHAQGKESLELSRRKKLQPVEDIITQKNVDYEVKILHGQPGQTIVDYAKEEKADIIVIGSRGLNAFQELVIGSVSQLVVKKATCPVLIVK